jgi:RNA polymerase sigma-70 factor, ECF subfamily
VKKEELIHNEIIKRVKSGDQKAFELLFNLYYNQLVNFAYTFLKDVDIANEIVQETYIKVWEIKDSLDENLSIKAFLYKCTHNNCINYIKKAQVTHKLTEKYITELSYRLKFLGENQPNSFFDDLAEEELELCVQKAIDSLPQQCREIFLMSRFKGLTYLEIANKLSISVNTVKTQLSRALQKIRLGIKK